MVLEMKHQALIAFFYSLIGIFYSLIGIFYSQIVERSSLVSVLFREAISHHYIFFFSFTSNNNNYHFHHQLIHTGFLGVYTEAVTTSLIPIDAIEI